MEFRVCFCVLLVVLLTVTLGDAKKSFSSRRKSGNNRRGSSSTQPKPPPPQPSTTHNKPDTNTNFLNSERVGSSHGSGSVNMYHRQTPFNNKPPEAPKQSVPQSNGPIGFEKINSEVQRKPANVPSAPAYPGGPPSYSSSGAASPGKPVASAPNGPPPAYPGHGSPSSGFDPPPAYPGRPVNAPPVYSANNPTPNFGQRNPAQPGFGGYPNQQGGFSPQGSYPGQGYPTQQNFGYPNGGNSFGQTYPGQQNFGYSNAGSNFGAYPNQGFGSYPSGGFGNTYNGGFGQSHSGFGGSPFGGTPFGQSQSFGGGLFGSNGYGNSHYSPNNFGYSNNPGLFGSQMGNSGYNTFGQHKRSRFGGLPIPIPIPIPIPLGGFGGFGGFGGRSHNHRLLDTFVKGTNVTTANDTSVFILNNSTVTPCTTDQFIYDSLNITVMSCTTGNCTAVKVFVTSNQTQNATVRSAALTMCLEPRPTYSTHSENVNPTVSDLHEYWMRVCREVLPVNTTDGNASNVTVRIREIILNETVVITNSTGQSVENITAQPENTTSIGTSYNNSENTSSIVVLPNSSDNASSILVSPNSSENASSIVVSPNSSENASSISVHFNTTNTNTTSSKDQTCEIFSCSWMEMCLPAVEVVSKMAHRPCLRLKMCQSPSTPISTFATLNNSISRQGDNGNVMSFNDVANLTLITYIPPNTPTNCSQDATDPACQTSVPQQGCVASGEGQTGGPTCVPPEVVGSTSFNVTNIESTTSSTTTST